MIRRNALFFKDDFTTEELEAANLSEKSSKMAFLDKILKAVNHDGSLDNVKSAKIVAGKEPEQTALVCALSFFFYSCSSFD